MFHASPPTTPRVVFFILLSLCCAPCPLRGAESTDTAPHANNEGQGDGHKHTNALIHEKSPYLRQHAHNPVDWVPWSEAALKKAKQEDKLIFLSIGYSTCHWCHVMEEECFEDEEVAALLNRDFVCIKVDREQRPDVDSVYMSIAQGLGSGGGWPLTVVMTPDQRPFFAGTYIPKHDKYRITGLMTRLPALVRQYRSGSDELDEAARRAERRIDLLNQPLRPVEFRIDDEQLDEIFIRFLRYHAPDYGGFGGSMKVPSPHQLLYLLSCYQRTGNERALAAVKLTLDKIRAGGICDQVGFGIHRYATDRVWKVPHFEKMLYDQAQLVMACAACYWLTNDAKYRRMTEEVCEYVFRDLTSPQGAFYSAEDADSEGEEGKFYVWTLDELKTVLTEKQFGVVRTVFDIQGKGNWMDGATGERQPTNILHMTSEGANTLAEGSDDYKKQWEAARLALLKARSTRVRPLRDEKVLADWNGLMIAALARASRRLGEAQYVQAAARAFEFVDTNMRDDNGRLRHAYLGGGAAIPAYLDDHVFLAWGAVELYRATYDPRYLKSAQELIADVNERFGDETDTGYFLTASDAEQLPVRPQKFADMAVPSGNSVAALVLTQLARLTGEPEYEERAERLEGPLSRILWSMPSRGTQFGVALEYRRSPGVEVVVVGDPAAKETKRMLEIAERHTSPAAVTILLKDVTANTDLLSEVAPFTGPYRQIDGKPTAYVCRNRTCRAPTNDPDVMLEQLGELTTPSTAP